MKLYLGTECPSSDYFHYPIIRIEPRALPPDAELSAFTHIIFTSKNAVRIFLSHFPDVSSKTLIAVGQATASLLPSPLKAVDESQEGIIALLQPLDLVDAYILLPRSSKARHAIDDFLQKRNVHYKVWDLYDPVPQMPFPMPSLDQFEEIIFTSPSTVQAFFEFFGKPPAHLKITCQGPVTQTVLTRYFHK